MFESIPPLQAIIDHGPRIFAFDFGRYLIAASLIVSVVWGLRRTRLASRKIQQREASTADVRREFFQSLKSVLVYIFGAGFLIWGTQHGLFHEFEGSFGPVADLALLGAVIVAHDAYFYWTHRAMHHPRLFRLFHRAHHRSVTPTPWAAYSFAVPEAAVMFLFVPLWLFFVPTPGNVMFVWLAFQILRNAMGHAGFEFFPRWWLKSPLTGWINTTVHHDLHHAGSFTHNYGLYFTWWDKLMGTEHPDYVATFDRVTAPDRAAATQRLSTSASPQTTA